MAATGIAGDLESECFALLGAAQRLVLLPQHGTGAVLLDMASGKAWAESLAAAWFENLQSPGVSLHSVRELPGRCCLETAL